MTNEDIFLSTWKNAPQYIGSTARMKAVSTAAEVLQSALIEACYWCKRTCSGPLHECSFANMAKARAPKARRLGRPFVLASLFSIIYLMTIWIAFFLRAIIFLVGAMPALFPGKWKWRRSPQSPKKRKKLSLRNWLRCNMMISVDAIVRSAITY